MIVKFGREVHEARKLGSSEARKLGSSDLGTPGLASRGAEGRCRERARELR